MNIIRDVAKELFSMFMTDLRLTMATIVLVTIVAGLVVACHVEPLLGGGILLVGCLAIVVEAAVRETRGRHPSK